MPLGRECSRRSRPPAAAAAHVWHFISLHRPLGAAAEMSIEREDGAVESESGSLLRELSAKLTEGVHERLPPGMHRDGVARMPGLYRAT